jgi:S-adenosylmethionine:tRNA-ribosyltransferase-isomerase (queuine synthetase)
MRKLLSLFLFAGMTRVADAHTLAADDSLPMQLVHQLLGSHHLPISALIVLVGILVFRVWQRRLS